jgi:hypothetical protein
VEASGRVRERGSKPAGRGITIVAPPLVAFAAAQLALWIAAAATGYRYLSAGSWARFDSTFYVTIAQTGYHLVPCTSVPGHFHPGAWCGNAGWFPGYPIVVSPFVHIGLPSVATALLVSLSASVSRR